jgi:hypothetical protein
MAERQRNADGLQDIRNCLAKIRTFRHSRCRSERSTSGSRSSRCASGAVAQSLGHVAGFKDRVGRRANFERRLGLWNCVGVIRRREPTELNLIQEEDSNLCYIDVT